MHFPANPRLTVDLAALASNWARLQRLVGGAAVGAAVKADGYGLGAAEVTGALARAGCRDFFVATWAEAAALVALADGAGLAVLHGVQPGEMRLARTLAARPVLCTPAQVAYWRGAGGGPCDVMVDTGINRLGLSPAEAVSGLLDGLDLDTLHSHLACADMPGHPLNARQRQDFAGLAARISARRYSLANSAGIALGPDFAFDLTRPGIALYGGSYPGLAMAPVAHIEARIVQLRNLAAGESIGYGATFTATAPMRAAVLAIGYADGYPRSLSGRGTALAGGTPCPVVGRVSMDLTVVDVSSAGPLAEGDWLGIDFDLARTAALAGMAQYELLTGLGDRYSRVYL